MISSACNLLCNALVGSSTRSFVHAFQPRVARRISSPHRRLYATSNLSSKGYGPVPFRTDAPTHLDGVEDAVDAALLYYQSQVPNNNTLYAHDTITTFPPEDRETIGVASKLRKRLASLARNKDCRRCWMQKRHCVCVACPPLEEENASTCFGGIENVNRLFLLTHHKEICMVVDTAKIILSSFPNTARLVVNGIGKEFQPSIGEMLDAYNDAMSGRSKCLILFPTEDAKTFSAIEKKIVGSSSSFFQQSKWDVIVIDGTWNQARKMHQKYFPDTSREGLHRVQLSSNVVELLGGDNNDIKGHQLRRHPTKWREISTHEATRLLLEDMHTGGQFEERSKAMSHYQEILNAAARRQLGPPREKEVSKGQA
jgi:DTW domain-containing protein YfiP